MAEGTGGLFDLTGRVAVVTGGTRGIGAAIAAGLQEAGARVWIHGSGEETTIREAKKYGYRCGWGNLAEADGFDRLIRSLFEEEKKVDVLVNNAGCESYASVEEGTEEFLETAQRINCRAPYFLVQRLLPLLKNAGKASVINVTSIHETVPVRNNSAYCMAKASLAMYTKVAALELAKYGIRVNNLAPGAIVTDMNRELIEKQEFGRWIPLGRPGNCRELAGPAVFLASEAASYVTGTTLVVDGGYRENLLRY